MLQIWCTDILAISVMLCYKFAKAWLIFSSSYCEKEPLKTDYSLLFRGEIISYL